MSEQDTRSNLGAINDIYATHAGLVEREGDDGDLVETPGEIPEDEHQGDPDADPTDLVDADGQTADDRGEGEPEPEPVDPEAEGLADIQTTDD